MAPGMQESSSLWPKLSGNWVPLNQRSNPVSAERSKKPDAEGLLIETIGICPRCGESVIGDQTAHTCGEMAVFLKTVNTEIGFGKELKNLFDRAKSIWEMKHKQNETYLEPQTPNSQDKSKRLYIPPSE